MYISTVSSIYYTLYIVDRILPTFIFSLIWKELFQKKLFFMPKSLDFSGFAGFYKRVNKNIFKKLLTKYLWRSSISVSTGKSNNP